MFEAYRRYADFQGRASRSEYWLFTLFIWIVMIVCSVLMSAVGTANVVMQLLVSAVLGVFMLGSFIPALSVAFRRLHDTNRTAWWLLISFIPLVGGVALLIFNCLPGDAGPNRFGPPSTKASLQETFA